MTLKRSLRGARPYIEHAGFRTKIMRGQGADRPTGDGRSVLHLLRRLVDAHLDGEHLASAAVARAAQRRRAKIVEPDSDPYVGVGRANSIGGIERHPAEIGHEGFS